MSLLLFTWQVERDTKNLCTQCVKHQSLKWKQGVTPPAGSSEPRAPSTELEDQPRCCSTPQQRRTTSARGRSRTLLQLCLFEREGCSWEAISKCSCLFLVFGSSPCGKISVHYLVLLEELHPATHLLTSLLELQAVKGVSLDVPGVEVWIFILWIVPDWF